MHFLEITFRSACKNLNATILGGTQRATEDQGKNKVVVLHVDKVGYSIAGKLNEAGLQGINRSKSKSGKRAEYTVTITYPSL